VVGHWIGPANLDLDPESETVVELFEDYIGAGRVAEQPFQVERKQPALRTSSPPGWAPPYKLLL
jgi:hypothetical protein